MQLGTRPFEPPAPRFRAGQRIRVIRSGSAGLIVSATWEIWQPEDPPCWVYEIRFTGYQHPDGLTAYRFLEEELETAEPVLPGVPDPAACPFAIGDQVERIGWPPERGRVTGVDRAPLPERPDRWIVRVDWQGVWGGQAWEDTNRIRKLTLGGE